MLRLLLQGLRATGVAVQREGAEETLHAAREVVLAAGAYGSPQVLILSGGGIADELAPLAIPSAIDLPLGANLQDHTLLPMSCRTDEASLLGAGSRRMSTSSR